MPGHLVDIILVVLALLFAINGYRQGFVIGILSFVGFFGGALLGLQVAPSIAVYFDSPTIRVLAALSVIFAIALLLQALCAWLGSRLRQGIRDSGAQVLDDIGGALVSIVAVLLVAWMVTAPLASSSVPGLSSAIRNSSIVSTVNAVMPDPIKGIYKELRDTVNTNGFPEVFGGLAPTNVPSVGEPDGALAGSDAVRRVHASVVKVLGDAPSCSRRIEGSGFVYAPEHVMTNAHVVAGTRKIQIDAGGTKRAGTVVAYDPMKDLAVIYVPGLTAPALPWATAPAQSNQDAIVLGYPLDGPYTAKAARIRDSRQIKGPDIYNSGTVVREVYTIRSEVRSGNSGGPLISPAGAVYGVIFAAAADDETTGFAVTAAEAASVAGDGKARTAATNTGDCA
ncbi:serine protease [Longispora fulva]|uniref:S1-C subfamily serine protease n=1 Tax=Longispora fulva TaxID=619741 RepID=A0A8J7KLH2_9ACTN|nr:MarP family serine protease [Longispora fulva]MBG6139354.1 S1-C subfamily serine protease [Longispora fulva]GIG58851.1 serine protease [Longispora fulva]